MADIARLKKEIVDKGYTVEKIAQLIGVNKSTLYRKFQNNGLKIKEAALIAQKLNLTEETAINIFLPEMSHTCDI